MNCCDQAAITGRGHSAPCHRRPHLGQRSSSTDTPLCRSMAVSGLKMPSHFQHRILFTSGSGTRLSFNGMVVLLGQALELLIQEGGPEGAEPVSLLQWPVCFPILSQDDGIRIWNCAPSAQEHTQSLREAL